MKAIQLSKFGLDEFKIVEVEKPVPGPGQVLVEIKAASINFRDYLIARGVFAPASDLPIIPLSDGAGKIVDIGQGVTELQIGDRVTPLFFPKWMSGDALGDERSVSSGLEADGVLRQYGVYDERAVVKFAEHLSYEEAACFPCAGLTAWTSLVTVSHITRGECVLVLGTGGVALFTLQFAKALGAKVIITSSNDERLERAKDLGADYTINYLNEPEWGAIAKDITNGRGVDMVLEVGGTGTLPQSFKAIRRGGHIPIIGNLSGAKMDIEVYQLILTNAHLHGIGVGHREGFEQMMRFVGNHELHPVIAKEYPFEEASSAIYDAGEGGHFGKLIVNIKT